MPRYEIRSGLLDCRSHVMIWDIGLNLNIVQKCQLWSLHTKKELVLWNENIDTNVCIYWLTEGKCPVNAPITSKCYMFMLQSKGWFSLINKHGSFFYCISTRKRQRLVPYIKYIMMSSQNLSHCSCFNFAKIQTALCFKKYCDFRTNSLNYILISSES